MKVWSWPSFFAGIAAGIVAALLYGCIWFKQLEQSVMEDALRQIARKQADGFILVERDGKLQLERLP